MYKIIGAMLFILIVSCNSNLKDRRELEKELLMMNYANSAPEISILMDNLSKISFDSLVSEYKLLNKIKLDNYVSLYSSIGEDSEREYFKIRYIGEYYQEKMFENDLYRNSIIGNAFHVGFVPDPRLDYPNLLRIEARIDYNDSNRLPYFIMDGTSDTIMMNVIEDSILIPNEEARDTVSGYVWIYNTPKDTWLSYWVQIVTGY